MFRDKPLISVWGVPVGAAKLVPCNPSRGRPLSESQKRRTRGRKEREKRKEKKEIPRRFAGAQYIISQEARLAKKSPPPLFSRSLASPPLATPRHPSPPLASPTLASPPLRATPPRHPTTQRAAIERRRVPRPSPQSAALFLSIPGPRNEALSPPVQGSGFCCWPRSLAPKLGTHRVPGITTNVILLKHMLA
jgi:hypothetical protein